MERDLICKDEKKCGYWDWGNRERCLALNHFGDKGNPPAIAAEGVGGVIWGNSTEQRVDDPRSMDEFTMDEALTNIENWHRNPVDQDLEIKVTRDEDSKRARVEVIIPTINLEVYSASYETLHFEPSRGGEWGLDEKTGRAILLRKASPGQPLA